MAFELAKLLVRVRADSSRLKGDFKGIRSQSRIQGSRAGMAFSAAFSKSLALGIGLIGISSLKRLADESVELSGRQEKAERRIASVIKATGGAAGFSANSLKNYASALQKVTTTGDEELLESMAVLLTFKNVTGDVFKRTTEAALDLSASGLGTLEGNILQLGKALEDPIRGMDGLRRTGTTLDEATKQHIKSLTEQNRLYDAQTVLLDAVEAQAKGAARELALTDAGKLDQINNKIGDMKELLGAGVLPLVLRIKQAWLGILTGMTASVSTGSQLSKIMKDMDLAVAQLERAWIQLQLTMMANPAQKGLRDALKSVDPVLEKGLSAKIGAPFNVDIKSGLPKGGLFNSILGSPEAALKARADVLDKMIDRGLLPGDLAAANAGIGGNPAARKPTVGGGLADARKGFGSGSVGIADLGRMIQEAILDQEQERILKAIEKGNQIDQEHLEETKKQTQTMQNGMVARAAREF